MNFFRGLHFNFEFAHSFLLSAGWYKEQGGFGELIFQEQVCLNFSKFLTIIKLVLLISDVDLCNFIRIMELFDDYIIDHFFYFLRTFQMRSDLYFFFNNKSGLMLLYTLLALKLWEKVLLILSAILTTTWLVQSPCTWPWQNIIARR